MSSTQTSQIAALLDSVAGGAVEIVDLTQPLSESTPVIKLPPPFANTPGLSRAEISRYDDRGPAWAWYTLTVGEHVGTHLDAPIHWVTGKDGADVASVPADQLDRTGLRGGQDSRDRDQPGLPADRGGPRGLGSRERPRARRGVGSAPHRLGLPRAGRDGVPQRRRERTRDAGTRRGSLEMACLRQSISGFGVETVGIDAGAAGGFTASRCTTSCSAPAASDSPSSPTWSGCRSPAR